MKRLVREYLASLEAGRPYRDEALYRLIGQAVRKEAFGTSRQPEVQRRLENLLLGDARKRGETHQRAWDRLNCARRLALLASQSSGRHGPMRAGSLGGPSLASMWTPPEPSTSPGPCGLRQPSRPVSLAAVHQANGREAARSREIAPGLPAVDPGGAGSSPSPRLPPGPVVGLDLRCGR